MQVFWTSISEAKPHHPLILVRTKSRSHFIHCMCAKSGEIVPWDEQNERWTDGKFGYEDVTHWAAITEPF